MENIDRLKQAFAAWHESKGASIRTWLDLMHEEVTFHSMMEEAAGLSFAKDGASRDEIAGYFSGITETWDMVHFTPERYVSEGDDIAVFGYCAWRNKATGKTAQARFGHLWTFTGDKVSGYVEIFDSARAAAASVD